MVYALSNKGADVLADELGVERGNIDWRANNRRVGYQHILHALMISNLRSTLTLALEPRKHTALKTWKQGPELKAVTIVEGRRVAVIPDAFFTVEHEGHDLHFLCEVDRSTMTTKRFLRKLSAYWYWWKEGGHRRELGINRFRVLTISISDRRKENLRKIARNADDRKQGTAMFLFACERSYSLDEPETILNPIWQSPVNDTWYSILD